MSKADDVAGKYVKKETLLIVALVAFAAGFLGGIAFGIYKSGPVMSGPIPDASQQIAQEQKLTAEQIRIIQDLESKTSSDPNDSNAWILLGNVYFDTHQYEKSIRAYQKSLDLNPDNPDVWTDMGVMYRRNEEPKKAIEAFEKAIAVDPKHEVSRLNKGIVLLHDLNDPDGAIKAWEGLVEVNPSATIPGGVQSIRDMLERLKASMK